MAETSTTKGKVMIKKNLALPLSFLPRQGANRVGNSWTTRGVMGLMSLGVLAWHSQHVQQQMKIPWEGITQGSSLMKLPLETEGSGSSPPSHKALHSLAAQVGCPGQPKMLLYSTSSCAQKLLS